MWHYVTFTSKKTSTWDPKNHVSYNYNKNCSRKFADVLVAAFIVETYIRAQKNKKYWFWYDTKQSWFEKSICYNRILYRQKIFYCPLIRDHYCFYGIIVYCITITVTCVLHIFFCASHFSLKLFSIWCDTCVVGHSKSSESTIHWWTTEFIQYIWTVLLYLTWNFVLDVPQSFLKSEQGWTVS